MEEKNLGIAYGNFEQNPQIIEELASAIDDALVKKAWNLP
jgi:hypothetical protein